MTKTKKIKKSYNKTLKKIKDKLTGSKSKTKSSNNLNNTILHKNKHKNIIDKPVKTDKTYKTVKIDKTDKNDKNNYFKYIVFDLDETLGHFVQFSVFVNALENYYTKRYIKDKIVDLLQLYPELFRPNIFNIFKYLQKHKNKDPYLKILLFTNNQGPKLWARAIIEFINNSIKSEIYNGDKLTDTLHHPDLFDYIIGAYKVNGHINENLRTSHSKKINDLKNIITNTPDISSPTPIPALTHTPTHTQTFKSNSKAENIPENINRENKIHHRSKYLFFDDQKHDDMYNKDVSYILLKPYIYNYDIHTMIVKYLKHYKNDFLNKDEKVKFYDYVHKKLFDYSHPQNTSKISKDELEEIKKKSVTADDIKESYIIIKNIKQFIASNT
jgi:hypothetical protein